MLRRQQIPCRNRWSRTGQTSLKARKPCQPDTFQLEAGYTFTYDRERKDRVRDHTAPELLMRIGLVDNFELRIGWDGYSWTDSQFDGETRGGCRVTREDQT